MYTSTVQDDSPCSPGPVEKFNDTYNKNFFRRQWFPSYVTLRRQSKHFQRFHNKHHRYSYLQGKTALEVIDNSDYTPVNPEANTTLPQLDELPDGGIVLIRFIRSDRQLDVFGKKFTVSKDLVYSYVKALIVTEIGSLQIYLGDELVQHFEYRFT